MIFVITVYTGITLVYAALIFAIWWLPKDAKPPIDNEPLSPKQRAIRTMLMIITGTYALLLIPACFVSFAVPFGLAMKNPEPSDFVLFLFTATFPYTVVCSIIVAWILFRRGNVAMALSVTLLPIVQAGMSFFIPGIWSAL